MAPRPLRSIATRFWSRVDASGGMDACWPWLGAVNAAGYGVLGRGRRGAGNVLAHRLSLEIAGRPPAPDEDSRHTCDNPPCVNPAHLLPGSRSDNIRDSVSRGRWGNRAAAAWVTRRQRGAA